MRGVAALGVLLVLAFIGLWLRVVFLPDARPDKVDSPTISLMAKPPLTGWHKPFALKPFPQKMRPIMMRLPLRTFMPF
ncbi:hypothetical protein JCM17844_16330 [Iodidimonas gelatinilytica]|uniref:Uncharacterized protein n=1 Tax=Iodidimonas gelatinilytica TaxID=1236966 RepID=A0A5A7MQ89_9PROT|nr:hypothetical protein JCM17844_16330 [Iodidimonas gelatinilytica]